MKNTNSPKNEEVTPSKKVLKQARLPFKLISDDSPKAQTPRPKKRKLSSTGSATLTKIGKVDEDKKEVDLLVVISDDDSKDGVQTQKDECNKTMNPLVRYVDAARKKKLQKSKYKKKKQLNNILKKDGSDKSENDKIINHSEVKSVDITDEPMEVDSDVEEIVEKSENVSNIHKSGPKGETCVDNVYTATPNKNEIKCDPVVNNIIKNDHANNAKSNKTKVKESSIEDNTVTPKNSSGDESRKKKIDISQSSICEESFTSSPSTPRRSNRNTSMTNYNGDTSLNDSTNSLNVTPKQQQKKIESAKKREEREKEKLEREKKKQQEKDEKARQKQEKEDQRKREKEEKEEARKKEKEEKEKQKELEKKLREEKEEQKRKEREEKEEQKRKEREEKEEQKRKEREAKEEEKRKKQEAVELEKLEQEQKKKKAAEAFVSFFVPKQKVERDQIACSKNDILSSFMIKGDMRLAPTTRIQISEENKAELEKLLKLQNIDINNLYLKKLNNSSKKPLSSGKTWPLNENDANNDDVMIIEDELPPVDNAAIQTYDPVIREKLRPKLLAFHENRRPPYWGTWRKRSQSIKPKKPFKMDQKFLDYDVDSDEDWEEEQEGESLDGSAAGSDDEPDADEYEVDNEVFVPHGYLSDEEATMDEDDVLSQSTPETQKAKLKYLEDEFESEMKKPTEKLKPRLYGPLWVTETGGKPEKCADVLWNYFERLAMFMNDPAPLLQPSVEQEDTEKKKTKKKKLALEGEQESPKSDKKKKAKQNEKDGKKSKTEVKKGSDAKKNQPVINTFLTKINNAT